MAGGKGFEAQGPALIQRISNPSRSATPASSRGGAHDSSTSAFGEAQSVDFFACFQMLARAAWVRMHCKRPARFDRGGCLDKTPRRGQDAASAAFAIEEQRLRGHGTGRRPRSNPQPFAAPLKQNRRLSASCVPLSGRSGGQLDQGFAIFVSGLLRDLGRYGRGWRLIVPAGGFQPVAYELLVEARQIGR